MRTILVMLSLWGTVSFAGLRHWRHVHAISRRDDQLRALLAGKVPLPRAAVDELSTPVRRAS